MAELWDETRRAPAAFIQWWTGELAGLLPRFLSTSSPAFKSCLILFLSGDDTILFERRARHGEKELARAIGDPELMLARLNERRYRKWPIVVRLGGDLGLRKVVDLPLAAREDLEQLLHFELDRLTPFKADEVCFAWRVLDTDPQNKRMQVALEMAPKAVIDNALHLVMERGRKIDRIELEGTLDREPLDLMPNAAEGEKEHKRGWFRRFLPFLVLGLAITALIIPMRAQQALVDKLDRQIAVVRAEAEESLALRETLDTKAAKRRFLVSAKNDRVTMTEVLAELTRLIPDHSHIIQLQIRDATIELNGLADKASDLIAILDQSPMLTAPQFRSSVTRDPRSGKERFQISVDLVGRSS